MAFLFVSKQFCIHIVNSKQDLITIRESAPKQKITSLIYKPILPNSSFNFGHLSKLKSSLRTS